MGHAEDETRGEGDSVKDHESDFEDDIPRSSSEVSDEKTKEAEGTSKDLVQKVTAFTSGLKAVLEPFPPTAWKVLVTLLLGAASTESTLCVFTAIFTVGHLGGLYLYQLPFFQDLVPPDDIYTRTGFGLAKPSSTGTFLTA
ncbi:piezo-type mechanosensitive ion channel component 2-like [Balaenoptera ricei]|uniref:piezo-type mechanosensitive ion channel component 2-like n=1 Tax=Balaenoptera ricei TaxID=2746895 RepID=UPI0028BF3870|nr:piezo-type mechanosensitive ion channel component 2-like [Balaenoptera ricei]